MLYHDVRTGESLIQNVFVVKHAAHFHVGRVRTLSGHMTRVVHLWGLSLERRRRVELHLPLATSRVIVRGYFGGPNLVVIELSLVMLDLLLLLLLLCRAHVVEVHAVVCLLRHRCGQAVTPVIVSAKLGRLVLAGVRLKLAGHSGAVGVHHILATKIAVSFLVLLGVA